MKKRFSILLIIVFLISFQCNGKDMQYLEDDFQQYNKTADVVKIWAETRDIAVGGQTVGRTTLESENENKYIGVEVLPNGTGKSVQPALISKYFDISGDEFVLGAKIKTPDKNGEKIITFFDTAANMWFDAMKVSGAKIYIAGSYAVDIEENVWTDVKIMVNIKNKTLTAYVNGTPYIQEGDITSALGKMDFSNVNVRAMVKYTATTDENSVSRFMMDNFYITQRADINIISTPAHDTDGVAQEGGKITVDFGTLMDTKYMGNFILKRNGEVVNDYSAVCSMKKLEITMNSGRFETDSMYTLELSDAAKSVWGEVLGEKTILFTTISLNNKLPTLEIVSPKENTRFDISSDVIIETIASDLDGNIIKVEFMEDGKLLGNITQEPYNFKVQSVKEGRHEVTVHAYDNNGGRSTKKFVFFAKENILPEVKITFPKENDVCYINDKIDLKADIKDPNGEQVLKAEFYINNEKVGEDRTYPYSVSYTPTQLIPTEFYVLAYDLNEEYTKSEVVTITFEDIVIQVLADGNFDDYTATVEAPGMPDDWYGNMGTGRMYGGKVDEEHGTSVRLETEVAGSKPWIGTADFPNVSGGTIVCEVDFMPTQKQTTEILTLLNTKSQFDTPLKFGSDGNISVYKYTNETNFNKYKVYKIGEWYHIKLTVDLYKNTFSLDINGDEITKNAQLATSNFESLKNVRISHCYVLAGGTTGCYIDNFTVKKLKSYPKIIAVNPAITDVDKSVEVSFNVPLRQDSITNVKLLCGTDLVEVPIQTKYKNGVLNVNWNKPLEYNTTYTLAFGDKIFSDEGLEMKPHMTSFKTQLNTFDVANCEITSDRRAIVTMQNPENKLTQVYTVSFKNGKMIDIAYNEGTSTIQTAGVEKGDTCVIYVTSEGKPVCPPISNQTLDVGKRSNKLFNNVLQYDIEKGLATYKSNDSIYSQVLIIVQPLGAEKVTPQNVKTTVAAIGQTMVTENGHYEYTFGFKDSFKSGQYVINATSEYKTESVMFLYSNQAEASAAVSTFNSATTASDLILSIEANSNALALDLTDFNSLSKTAVAEKMLLNKEGAYKTPADIFNSFNKSVAITAINSGKDIKAVLGKYAYIFGITTTDLDALEKADFGYSILSGRTYNKYSELNQAYSEAIMLTKISYPPNISGLIKYLTQDYKEVLQISTVKYESLKDKNAAISQMMGKTYTTAGAVKKDFDDGVESQANKESKPQSGGGGGGGGGGGSVWAPVDMVEPPPVAESAFTDLKDVPWAIESIIRLKELGVISGDGTGKFRPEDKITRGEFIKMLVGAMGIETKNQTVNFEDVPNTHWSYPYVAAAYNHEIVKGISESAFGIESNITRQDMSVLVYRAAKEKYKFNENTERTIFNDYLELSDYAKEAVTHMYDKKVISGIGNNLFAPCSQATRAEAVKIICNMMDLISEGAVQ